VEIRQDDVTGEAIVRFVESHLKRMQAITPPESVHALGAAALRSPDITVWSAWDDGELLGCGALRALGGRSGEIKAMRTADAHRRRGVGARILEHIIEEARRRGYERLYLETGAAAAFAPAQKLYERFGFAYCGPFGDYVDDPNSVFMRKEISLPIPPGALSSAG
jgi:putative acetyltransferase